MDVKIGESWKTKLDKEFAKPYFEELVDFVRKDYGTNTVFPPGKLIFSAFNHCSFDDLKVVIIGQDPYHGFGQANGLCFSVADGVKKPPSLVNIFKEIQQDIGKEIPESGNLERWASQGVLLLNATLTVRSGNPGSHQNYGWEQFTDSVIQTVSELKKSVVFLLWGAFAQQKAQLIASTNHLVLKSAHPSPFSADRGFFGNGHFSKTNAYLKNLGKTEINW